MSRISSWIELLGGWSLGRRPKTSDARHMIGSWAAKAMLSFLVFEWVVQLAWQSYSGSSHYNYFFNYVSDLGATTCGYQSLDRPGERWVCSPSFVAMDLALVFIGVSVVVAACLITSPVLWLAHAGDLAKAYRGLSRNGNGKYEFPDRSRFARVWTIIVRWSLAITGLAILTIGLIPEDYIPLVHDIAVVILLCGIVASLLSVGVLWFKRTWWSLAFFFLAVVAGLSALFMGFSHITQFSGLFERGVIYSFILGLAILGFRVSTAAQHERNWQLEQSVAPHPTWNPRRWVPARARISTPSGVGGSSDGVTADLTPNREDGGGEGEPPAQPVATEPEHNGHQPKHAAEANREDIQN